MPIHKISKPHLLKQLTIILIVLLSPLSSHAANVTMAFGNRIVPYSFPHNNTGIEIDIIREALAFKGHTLTPYYFNLAYVPKAFMKNKVDAAMTDLGEDLAEHGAFYGLPAVIYENALISLASRDLAISQAADIYDYSVVAFQGAHKRYPEWLTTIKNNNQYHETAQQQLQVMNLFSERYDLVLSDINIFKYYMGKMIAANGVQAKAIRIHKVFKTKEADYRPVFHDAEIRDDFNEGLQAIKASGKYQAIYKHYLQPSDK